MFVIMLSLLYFPLRVMCNFLKGEEEGEKGESHRCSFFFTPSQSRALLSLSLFPCASQGLPLHPIHHNGEWGMEGGIESIQIRQLEKRRKNNNNKNQ